MRASSRCLLCSSARLCSGASRMPACSQMHTQVSTQTCIYFNTCPLWMCTHTLQLNGKACMLLSLFVGSAGRHPPGRSPQTAATPIPNCPACTHAAQHAAQQHAHCGTDVQDCTAVAGQDTTLRQALSASDEAGWGLTQQNLDCQVHTCRKTSPHATWLTGSCEGAPGLAARRRGPCWALPSRPPAGAAT